MNNGKIVITHNFDPAKFMWLYAKYAYGVNPKQHCTNAIRGKYSKKFTRNNPEFAQTKEIVMDEYPELNWDAIYICGVAKKGYARHENYPHNVHVAIIPEDGATDEWAFENWNLHVQNARFEYVIPLEQLDDQFKSFPEQYVTCRMFRWAVDHYKHQQSKLIQFQPTRKG